MQRFAQGFHPSTSTVPTAGQTYPDPTPPYAVCPSVRDRPRGVSSLRRPLRSVGKYLDFHRSLFTFQRTSLAPRTKNVSEGCPTEVVTSRGGSWGPTITLRHPSTSKSRKGDDVWETDASAGVATHFLLPVNPWVDTCTRVTDTSGEVPPRAPSPSSGPLGGDVSRGPGLGTGGVPCIDSSVTEQGRPVDTSVLTECRRISVFVQLPPPPHPFSDPSTKTGGAPFPM